MNRDFAAKYIHRKTRSHYLESEIQAEHSFGTSLYIVRYDKIWARTQIPARFHLATDEGMASPITLICNWKRRRTAADVPGRRTGAAFNRATPVFDVAARHVCCPGDDAGRRRYLWADVIQHQPAFPR